MKKVLFVMLAFAGMFLLPTMPMHRQQQKLVFSILILWFRQCLVIVQLIAMFNLSSRIL